MGGRQGCDVRSRPVTHSPLRRDAQRASFRVNKIKDEINIELASVWVLEHNPRGRSLRRSSYLDFLDSVPTNPSQVGMAACARDSASMLEI